MRGRVEQMRYALRKRQARFVNGFDAVAKSKPDTLTFGTSGALLVADDVGNVIWRVTARPGT